MLPTRDKRGSHKRECTPMKSQARLMPMDVSIRSEYLKSLHESNAVLCLEVRIGSGDCTCACMRVDGKKTRERRASAEGDQNQVQLRIMSSRSLSKHVCVTALLLSRLPYTLPTMCLSQGVAASLHSQQHASAHQRQHGDRVPQSVTAVLDRRLVC